MGKYARTRGRSTGTPTGFMPGYSDWTGTTGQSASPEGKSVGGFLANAAGGVVDIVEGVGNLATAAVHDVVYNPIKEAVTLGGADTGYYLDDLAKAMPGALAEDYKRRYGSGWGGFLEGLYEDPLAFAGDVATVATLGGYSAAKGAQAASKIPGVASSLDDLARAGMTGSRTARAVDKILPGIVEKARTGDALAPLAGTRARISPLGKVESVERAFNPTRRFMQEGVIERALTKPVSRVSKEIGRLDPGVTGEANEITRLSDMMSAAREAEIARVYRPVVRKTKLGNLASRMVSEHGAEHVALRDKWINQYREALTPLSEIPDDFHLNLQGIVPAQGAGRLSFEEIQQALATGDLSDPKMAKIAETVQPHLERIREMEGELPLNLEQFRQTRPAVEGYLYHGSPEGDLSFIDPNYHTRPWDEGIGFYATESRERALGYQAGRTARGERRAGAADVGRLNYVQAGTNRALDMDAPADSGLWRSIATEHGYGPADWDTYIAPYLGVNPTNGKVMREVRSALSEELGPEAGYAIEDALFTRGFTATTHTEGIKSGDPHRVTVFKEGADVRIAPPEEVYEQYLRSVEKPNALNPDIAMEIEAGRRLIEQVAGEPLAGALDEVAEAIDNVRLTNFSQDANAFLEAGGSYKDLFDRQYLPLRVAEKLERNLDSFEDATDPFTLDDMVKSRGQKAPVYFPHNDTLTLRKGDFLMPWRLWGGRSAAKPKNWRASEGKNFERFLRGVKDAYETNPADAYARLAARTVKYVETENFLGDIIPAFGRPVSAVDELSSSERLVNLDGVRSRLRSQLQSEEAMAGALAEGMDIPQALESGIMRAVNVDPAEAADAALKGSLYAVPKAVADKIEAVAKSRVGGAKTRLFFDGPVNLWRSIILYARPKFYVNNVIGNTTFLALQGGRTSGVLRQLDRRYMNRVREALGEDALAHVEQGFHGRATQRATHLGAAEGTRMGAAVKGVKESGGGRWLASGAEAGRAFNGYLENLYRRESFLSAVEKQASRRGVKLAGSKFFRSHKRLEQIASAGADERVFRAAIEELNDALNDYTRLGPWERNVLRRFIMPFYPFWKHSAKTLLKMPYQHPAKARVLDLIAEASADFDGDAQGILPGWLQGALDIGPGEEPGDTEFFTLGGANPLEAALGSVPPIGPLASVEGIGGTNQGSGILGQVNPALKILLEQSTGRELYTGDRFSAPGVATAYGGDQYFDEQGRPVAAPTPNLLEHVAQQFPQYDTVRNLLPGAGARYDTGQTMTNPDGTPRFPVDQLQELLKYLGFSTYNFNVPEHQAKMERQRQGSANQIGR